MPVDFFATKPHYIDHAAPVFRALGETAGAFRVPDHLTRHLKRYGIENTPTNPDNPLVFLSRGDMSVLPRNAGLIFLAHGAEQSYDGKAQRKAAVHAAYGAVDGKATERAADAIRAWYARQDSKET